MKITLCNSGFNHHKMVVLLTLLLLLLYLRNVCLPLSTMHGFRLRRMRHPRLSITTLSYCLTRMVPNTRHISFLRKPNYLQMSIYLVMYALASCQIHKLNHTDNFTWQIFFKTCLNRLRILKISSKQQRAR